MRLEEAVECFVDHCRVAKRLSPHTLRAYETDLAEFCAFAGKERRVAAIDRETLRGFARRLFDDRALKETTVKRRMAALKVMFRWLERDEAIALSPFHRLDMTIKLPRTLPRALSGDEIGLLIRRAEHEADVRHGQVPYRAQLMRFVVVCLFTTGLRVSELCGVHMADIDRQAAAILVRGKGNRERKVYLPSRHAATVLTDYLKARAASRPDSDKLLTSARGRPLTPQAIRRLIAELAARAGISRRVTPHMLRHTAATQLIEAGVDIRFVQKLLGHASIATTQIYTQVSDSSLKSTLARADTLGRVVGGREVRRGR